MTHFAITIGPIFKTISNVKRTREVWGASYFFSFLAKTICKSIYDEGHEIIMPFVNDELLSNNKIGVGIFPDRIIFKAEMDLNEAKIKFVDTSISSLAILIQEKLKTYSELDVKTFLEQYLKINLIRLDLAKGQNAISVFSDYLNTVELVPNTLTKLKIDYLKEFLSNINSNGWLREQYDEKDTLGKVRFESLVEISTRELVKKSFKTNDGSEVFYSQLVRKHLLESNDDENDDGDQVFLEELKRNLKEDFKNYHKYFAVVYADGDKIGQTLNGLDLINKPNDLLKFSEKLASFCIKSKNTIRNFGRSENYQNGPRDYGAVPIYIGGDDLLFFTPICVNGKSIIDLIEEIDADFTNQNWSEISPNVQPSLSYGISICYYKNPLGEAVADAYNLMKFEAKKFGHTKKDPSSGGNSFSMKLLKHSGTEFQLTLNKGNSKNAFLDFKSIIKCVSDVNDKSFVNAISFKIRDNLAVLSEILWNENSELLDLNEVQLNNFFINYLGLNPKGKTNEFNYLISLKSLFTNLLPIINIELKIYECNDKILAVEKLLKNIYSSIRAAKFLTGQDEVKN